MDLFAYIDPGTGSAFIQAVIGLVLAGTFIMRSFIRQAFYRVKGLFKRSKDKTPDNKADKDDKKDEQKDK